VIECEILKARHKILTFGIVIVFLMVLDSKSQRRSVLACWMPVLGFRTVMGTTKSEVRMRPLFQSILSP
jgi:hypothetical protein